MKLLYSARVFFSYSIESLLIPRTRVIDMNAIPLVTASYVRLYYTDVYPTAQNSHITVVIIIMRP